MHEIFGLEGQPAWWSAAGYGSGAAGRDAARAAGWVAVADIDSAAAREVAREIDGLAITGDVTTEGGANAVVDEAHDVLGGLTRVANIVGLVKLGAFIDTDLAHWEAQLQLNLYSQLLVCHARQDATCWPRPAE